jgi:hypothetical protein
MSRPVSVWPLCLSALLAQAQAQTPPAQPAPGAQDGSAHPANALPMQFFSIVAGDEIYEALKKYPTFAPLDKEKLGSPIRIRVSLEYGRGSSAQVASAVLTIATLGLLPAVTNRDLTVTYDVVVNGSVITSYSYSKRVTRVFNVYSTDKTHGLGDDGLAWVIGTANQFALDLPRDAGFADLEAEYRYYYAAAAVR